MARKTVTKRNARGVRRNGATHYPRGLYDDVLALAGTIVRGKKDSGADKLGSLADATREFAAAMPEMANLRVYVTTAADRLDDLSDYVTHTDFEAIIDDAGTFARNYPMATLGIAIAAGLGASRLVGRPAFLRTPLRRATAKRPAAARTKRPARAPSRASANA